MPLQRPEVKHFVGACENIQALLAQGTTLKQEERDLITFCVHELLSEMQKSQAAA